MLNRTTSLIVLGAVLVAAAPFATADTAADPVPAPAASQTAPLVAVVDADTAMRCSAAFGIIAGEQKRGVASALKYPPLDPRGREFFVQAAARLMEEQKLTREAMQQRFKAEVNKLQGQAIAASDPDAYVRGVMDPCLKLLDATVPAAH